MAESSISDPSTSSPRGGNSRGVGAGIALIFMTPVVLISGVFFAYAGAVRCGNNGPGVRCQAYSAVGYSVAVVLPAVLGIICLLTRRRWSGAPLLCWVLAIVLVPLLIFS